MPKYVFRNCFAKHVVVKYFIFSDGKNIIIGGETKVRG